MGPDTNLVIARLALAAVWLYQGLWHKLLRAGHHAEITAQVPFGGPWLLPALGVAECGLALWILSGRRSRECAWAQTVLIVSMNVGGLAFAGSLIPDPLAMITQNAVLLALAWRIAK